MLGYCCKLVNDVIVIDLGLLLLLPREHFSKSHTLEICLSRDHNDAHAYGLLSEVPPYASHPLGGSDIPSDPLA